MAISGLLDSNQYEYKCLFAADTSAEFHIFKLHSALDNTSPNFKWYGQNPVILKLRTFGCDIYPITSSTKTLDNIIQEGLFMGYTNSRATIKWWDLHTKNLKYCLYRIFDEHNNKIFK